MKSRSGFVSNSSSTSFICDVCGVTSEPTWEGVREAGMYNCVRGHTFCEEHLTKSIAQTDDASEDEEVWIDEYELPEEYCPICQFQELSEWDTARYLEKVHGISREEVFKEIKLLNKRRKKLYDREYITHVCTKLDINPLTLAEEIPARFTNYEEYSKFLRG